MKIDTFAHVLLPNFYQMMLAIDANLPQKMPFLNLPLLTDLDARKAKQVSGVKQVISYVNLNPEDFVSPAKSLNIVNEANQELIDIIKQHPDQFFGGVAMLALNNVAGSVQVIEDVVKENNLLFGIQLFTRHLGKSVADPSFKPIFAKCAELNIPIWLHPVFDQRKPDNNLVFSWEYELSQAMLEIVKAGYFREFPNLKIIIHHAGAMVPFFSGRIEHILKPEEANDFHKFYVDTAILGNPKALELAVDYFGIDHVLFGTDAPFGIAPAGATNEIINALSATELTKADLEKIYKDNFMELLKD